MLREIKRRHFIKTAAAMIPLPFLPSLALADQKKTESPIKRVCFINLGHGMMPHNFFPTTAGKDYKASVYLKHLEPVRSRYTVFSGLSHDGISNHVESQGFLTGYPKGNSVSVDQLIAPTLSKDRRYDSLVLSPFVRTSGSVGTSYNRSGVMIPLIKSPAALYAKLFTDVTAKERDTLMRNLRTNKSVLDDISADDAALKRKVNSADALTLQEYYQAIRDAEIKLARTMKWLDTPKPNAPFKLRSFPEGIFDLDMMGDYLGLEADLMHLALHSDSTRVITMNYAVNDLPLEINGTSTNAHRTFSHHGNDPDKMKALATIEGTQFKRLAADFILKMNQKQADGRALLDDTMVMVGSNLGNPPNHSGRNLPIIVAGAGFEKQHGRHLAYDKANNEPLCNLFLTMLHKIGVERKAFGISTGTLKGISG